jgi:hypothetical protein
VVETATTEDILSGDSIIKTVSNDGFNVGDTVGIGVIGSPAYETGVIDSFSSIVLTAPLQNDHPAGTVVTLVKFGGDDIESTTASSASTTEEGSDLDGDDAR